MDPSFSQASADQNFEFAFNSSNFSDRVLRIEIIPGPAESKAEGEGCASISDWARHRKRRREDMKKDKAAGFSVYNPDHILDSNQPDTEDIVTYENNDGEAVAMIESPSGDEHSLSNESSWEVDFSLMKVKSIYISSAILAAKSPFFYKLFSNGMRESDQRHATLRINESGFVQKTYFKEIVSVNIEKLPQNVEIPIICSKQVKNVVENNIIYLSN